MDLGLKIPTFGGDGRGGYRHQTILYSSYNPGGHGRLLYIPGSSLHGYDSIHENERGYSRSHVAICGSMYQDISHSPFQNYVEIVDGDGRIGFRYHTIPSPSHNSGVLGISLRFIVITMTELYIGFIPANLSSYKHGGIYISYPKFPQEDIPRGV